LTVEAIMENASQIPLEFSESALPNDLLEWTDRHTLARLVLAAVQVVSLPGEQNGETGDGRPGFTPSLPLTLLTYCYATGTYGSLDIELRSAQDPMLRHLGAGYTPEAHALRRFRRYHRPNVKRCLTEVLHRAWHIRHGLGSLSAGDNCEWTGPYEERVIHPDVLEFAVEAEERIARAVRLDCWTSDW
jgi:hypothetical protein